MNILTLFGNGTIEVVSGLDWFSKILLMLGSDSDDDNDDEDCCSNPKNLVVVGEEDSFWGKVTIYKCRKCGNYVR